MDYIALARKYRPKTLEDVFGQNETITILKNAIIQNKLHHALVFTGTRGIGKTTLARILALSMNCQANDLPNTVPCMKCDSCLAILSNSNQDVIEIDAASKNGVDSVREIIDSCNYPPSFSRYKIYIVDEFHMLSKAAFNAFLKTLEEPREYIKFIFATTEIQKIPQTVLSRCQKFFLKSFSDTEIATYIKSVLDLEGYEIDDNSLKLISLSADGSIRDALSILESIIVESHNNKISYEMVKNNLNIIGSEAIFNLLQSIINFQTNEAIQTLNNILSKGSSVKYILVELAKMIHKVIVSLETNDIADDDIVKQLFEINDITTQKMLRLWQVFLNGLNEINTTSFSINIILEMIIIKACNVVKTPDVLSIDEKTKEISDIFEVETVEKLV